MRDIKMDAIAPPKLLDGKNIQRIGPTTIAPARPQRNKVIAFNTEMPFRKVTIRAWQSFLIVSHPASMQ